MKTVTPQLPMETQANLVGYLHEEMELAPGRDARPCVLICPGGAYRLVSPREADPPAFAFFARGYNVFVLTYTVGGPDQPPLGLTPLMEISSAVMLLRENHRAWQIDPDKIALCGFSAGGHLCASLGILWDAPELKQALDTRGGQNRPNAMVLCYPVISAGEHAHRDSFRHLTGDQPEGNRLFSLENQVSPTTAPAFLWHTVDDASVPVENSLLLAASLRRQGVPFECHLFHSGVHGLSMGNAEVGTVNAHCQHWFPLCMEWLNGLFGFEE